MFTKANSGWIAFVVLSLTPLIPWYFALLPFYYRFSNTFSTFTSLGEMLGLVGITMFSLTLILSARLEFFEDFFGGMNKVYVAHHTYGSIALILLLLHPLMLAASRMTISMKTAEAFLLPGADWSINFGLAGLLFMMSLLVLTLFVNLPYPVWKLTHKYLGGVFLIASIHGFFVSSDIARDFPLRVFMFVVVCLGGIAFIYRTLFGRFLVRRMHYIVKQVNLVKDNVTEVILHPQNNKIKVFPGQFIFISLKSKQVSDEVHPFSVSTVFPDDSIAVTAKSEGDYTSTLKNLQVEDKAYIEGGFGRFSFHRYKNKQQIWVAGGIGITPFYSMAQQLPKTDYQVDLYYVVRTEDEAVYLPILLQLTQGNPNFRVFPSFTKVQGRLTAESIGVISGDIVKKEFFICGPPPMMKSMRAQLVKLKVPNRNIHTEEFSIW